MDFLTFLEFSVVGLAGGGLLALIALGFVLIYKGTRVVNFAMGEFMMMGAYLFYTTHVAWKLHWAPALALTLAGIAALGALVERTILRPLSGQPVISIVMATIGLGTILHGAADAIWGGDNLALPELLPRKPVFVGEILIPGQVLWSFAAACALIGAFLAYFRFSRTGVAMRAAASDPVTAYAMGIDVRRTSRLTWIFAGLTGAVAGIIVASMTSLSPALGNVALGVLAVIILGGLDSVLGAIVAGLAIGWLEAVTVGFIGGKARDLVPYVVVLVILMVRPYGLFGTREIERL
ncbi:MAG: branched-chain amino acid ABC transporter permease [Burkholderiales bacterium]|nr:branched-chain amino acid ABC transporter permease [Burkholderiales bacterium]